LVFGKLLEVTFDVLDRNPEGLAQFLKVVFALDEGAYPGK
jgi:hypothetical protein